MKGKEGKVKLALNKLITIIALVIIGVVTVLASAVKVTTDVATVINAEKTKLVGTEIEEKLTAESVEKVDEAVEGNSTSNNGIKPKVVNGSGYVVALTPSGEVYTWGRNSYGQLGFGDTNSRNNPTKILGLEDVVDIAAGDLHTLFLKKDGTVWAAGRNDYGNLADGTYTARYIPVKSTKLNEILNGRKIVQIAVEDDTSYALDENGTVYAWGYGAYGQLGFDIPTIYNLIKISNEKIKVKEISKTLKIGEKKQIEVDYVNPLNVFNIVNKRGTLTYTSSDKEIAEVSETGEITAKSEGTARIIIEDKARNYTTYMVIKVLNEDVTNISKVVNNNVNVVTLAEDGQVTVYGTNEDGQFGNGKTQTSSINSENTYILTNDEGEIRKDVIDIAVGERNVSIVLANGTVWSSGNNNYGQLGVGNNERQLKYSQAMQANDQPLMQV